MDQLLITISELAMELKGNKDPIKECDLRSQIASLCCDYGEEQFSDGYKLGYKHGKLMAKV